MGIFNKKKPRKSNRHSVVDGSEKESSDDAWDVIFDSDKTGVEDASSIDVEKSVRKRKHVILLVAVLVAVLALAGVYLLYDHALTVKEEQEQSQQQPTEDDTTTEGEHEATGSMVNPSSNTNDVSDPAEGTVTSAVNKNEVTITTEGSSYRITFPSITEDIKPSSSPCDLSSAAASCFIGQGKVKDDIVQFYAFRDAKDSSLLYSEEPYKVTSSNGAALVYTRKIASGDKSINGLVIIFRDQTGVIVTSDNESIISAMASGKSRFTASAQAVDDNGQDASGTTDDGTE